MDRATRKKNAEELINEFKVEGKTDNEIYQIVTTAYNMIMKTGKSQ